MEHRRIGIHGHEEHDGSYKQEDGCRYSARAVAVWRARQRAIPIVLGSATPSLESLQLVQAGQCERLVLPDDRSGRYVLSRGMPQRLRTSDRG